MSLMTALFLSVAGGDTPSHKAYAQISDAATTSASSTGCQNLPISSVTASGNRFLASNDLDDNLNTAWVNNAIHSWIQADLETTAKTEQFS